jgi:hypothetical protein
MRKSDTLVKSIVLKRDNTVAYAMSHVTYPLSPHHHHRPLVAHPRDLTPHVNNSELGGRDSRYATPHSPSCSPTSTPRSMLTKATTPLTATMNPISTMATPNATTNTTRTRAQTQTPMQTSDASPNVTVNQTRTPPEREYLDHVHVHEASHDMSTSDACQPDALITYTTAQYQHGDVEDSVSGRGMQLGHPGWCGDPRLLNSKPTST